MITLPLMGICKRFRKEKDDAPVARRQRSKGER
jgi:hypothetical protein